MSGIKQVRFLGLSVTLVLAVTANNAPAFANPQMPYPPTPQTAYLGGTAHFTVIASGSPPLSYEWRKNEIPMIDGGRIGGATTDVLTLTDVHNSDAASYRVIVTDAGGSVASSNVTLTVIVPQGGNLDFSFDPGSTLDNSVAAAVVQPDGKLLIGGAFTTIYGAARGRIARLNADGSADNSFGNGLVGANDSVSALALQPDGKVLVAGSFSTVNGVSRSRIARLNPNGTVDTAFLNGLPGASSTVTAVAVQPDGKVLLGGIFTSVNGMPRNRIARVNADGTLDTGFLNGLAGANGTVSAVTVQPDGKVMIAGQFSSVNGVSRGSIARLNADGTLDVAFLNGLSGANGTIVNLEVRFDGRILIAGGFTAINGVSRSNIARLNPDGTLDATFAASVSHAISTLVMQSDQAILIGGKFTAVNGDVRNRVARLNADGSTDLTTFVNGVVQDGDVTNLALQPDGKVLMAGTFTRVNDRARIRFVRLNANGSLDSAFPKADEGPNRTIRAVAVQTDGKVLIGGDFTEVNRISRSHVARLDADGNLDTLFLDGLDGANGSVFAITIQADGKILIGGSFSMVNGVSQKGIARLNEDGTVDLTFHSGFSSGRSDSVQAIAMQPDGKLLIGGIAGPPPEDAFVARLNADGSLDPTFLNGFINPDGYWVNAMALQPDGKVLIGGNFQSVHGSAHMSVARLNGDGTLDPGFVEAGMGSFVFIYGIAVQPDGKVLVGGDIRNSGGASVRRIARLNSDGSLDTSFLNGLPGPNIYVYDLALQPDGKVLVGGSFSTVNGAAHIAIARLHPDGSTDEAFVNGLAGVNVAVLAIALQSDGRVLIGGSLSQVNGISGGFIARLHGAPPVAPAIVQAPSAAVTYDGCCTAFTVVATGTVPLEYQWRRNGVDLEDGADVSGAHAATLTLGNIDGLDEGAYSVAVSNSVGSETSADALLKVDPAPQCKVASCDATLGCVLTDLSGIACDDQSACTTGDTCSNGICGGVSGTAPGTVAAVSASKAGEVANFTWTATPAAATYDTLRGRVGAWPVGSVPSSEVCFNDGVDTSMSDPEVPAVDSGYWYLFSAANVCGSGGYGVESVHGLPGPARLSKTCP